MTRSLQYGWQMEDLDEAIRTSTGRQRKNLMRQKERASLMQNIEGEKIDEDRSRQEQLWGREDERYKKQEEYSQRLMELDKKQFDLGKEQREWFYNFDKEELARKIKEYQEQKKLEDQMQELQRKYQYDQIQLQKESAGVSAAAAAEQKNYNDQLTIVQGTYETALGTFKQMIENDPKYLLQSLQAMFNRMSDIPKENVDALDHLVMTATKLDNELALDKASAMLENINKLSIPKLNALINFLMVAGSGGFQ